MTELARIPLDGGAVILVELHGNGSGPVKAGRLGDAVREMPATLRVLLAPVVETAKTLLGQLREARPDELEVEFGVNLGTEAGAVITKTTLAGNIKVKMVWKAPDPSSQVVPAQDR
jgi:hypothetical protein